eukprot:1257209-Heterocapsa_arctica.AAC.1
MWVMRSQLERDLCRRLKPDNPVLAWLPRHAANCMIRFRIGQDGETPERRRAGRKWKRPMVTFGETVFFRPI